MSTLDSLLSFRGFSQFVMQKRAQEAETQTNKVNQAGETNKAEQSSTTAELNTSTTRQNLRQLPLREIKAQIGQDATFVRETVKNKLSEYKIPGHVKIDIVKNPQGEIAVNGYIQRDTAQQIAADLNRNEAFKAAYNRVNAYEPTMNYVDTVVKLTDTYGVGNNLFHSILSKDQQHNQLSDIAFRYEKMGENVSYQEQTRPAHHPEPAPDESAQANGRPANPFSPTALDTPSLLSVTA
ncbi:MAG: hypothetical protein MI864_19545 [Pseudomonadales bacterium]|nr:hypothetical protein [Pseudomonadales bacterium]